MSETDFLVRPIRDLCDVFLHGLFYLKSLVFAVVMLFFWAFSGII